MKKIIAIAIAAAATFGLSGCYDTTEFEKRKEQQKSTSLDQSLETQNLEKKRDLENDPSAIRYVYLLTYGDIVGYYAIEGKVSSSASQLAPENDIIRGIGGEGYIVDSSKDDGSYGQGDPGIFFFTTEGILVETDLNYLVSNQPIPIDVPRLNESE